MKLKKKLNNNQKNPVSLASLGKVIIYYTILLHLWQTIFTEGQRNMKIYLI